MAGALIGALRVSLGLDSAQFETGVKKARRDAQQASTGIAASFNQISSAAKMVAASIAAVGSAAVLVAVRQTINAMDDLSKAAQKTGTSAAELSKLQYAADLSGVASESLQRSLNRLNVAIVQVGPGAKGAAGALQAMGITAKTGTLDALMKVADQFQSMPDGAQKSALALELFGKAGADMIPLLNGGSAAIKDAADEAERLGIVIDGNTARAAEAFNDNLTRLKTAGQGVTMQITAGLVPALAAITDRLVDGTKVGAGWVQMGQAIGRGIINIGEAAALTGNFLGEMVRNMVALVEAGKALASGQGMKGVQQVLNNLNDRNNFQRKYIEAYFDTLRADVANFKLGDAKIGNGGAGGSMLGGGAGGKAVKGISAKGNDFVPANMESGWALRQLLDAGTPAVIDLNNQALRGVAETLRDLEKQDFSLEIIRPEAFQRAERFAEGLANNLSQALVFGQSLGGALVSSIKAAAAELITSRLLDFLLGGRGAGGFRTGGLLGSLFGIPGFADGTNFAPGGLAMVGERGRELVRLPRGSQVIPNGQTEAMLGRARAEPVELVVRTEPSPLFVTSVVQGSRGAARDEIRRATRPRMLRSPGA
jgi:hypothetical protein